MCQEAEGRHGTVENLYIERIKAVNRLDQVFTKKEYLIKGPLPNFFPSP